MSISYKFEGSSFCQKWAFTYSFIRTCLDFLIKKLSNILWVLCYFSTVFGGCYMEPYVIIHHSCPLGSELTSVRRLF